MKEYLWQKKEMDGRSTELIAFHYRPPLGNELVHPRLQNNIMQSKLNIVDSGKMVNWK